MAAEKKSDKIGNEEAFNEQYSRFKVWFSFKDGKNKSFYGREKNASILQIISRRVKEIAFDRQKGLESCIYLAESYKPFKGRYKTAIVYDRFNDREIRKYINGHLESYEEIIFTDDNRIDRFIIRYKNEVPVLVPFIPNIDFKEEINNALNKMDPEN